MTDSDQVASEETVTDAPQHEPNPPVNGAGAVVGVLAGLAGLATSYLAAGIVSVRESPLLAVAGAVIDLPIDAAGSVPSLLGSASKPLLFIGILAVLIGVFALIGRVSLSNWWRAVLGWTVLAAIGTVAVMLSPDAGLSGFIPLLVGLGTWLIVHAFLLNRLDDYRAALEHGSAQHSRRNFLISAAVVAGVSAIGGVAGRFAGGARRRVEESRDLLRLSQVTEPAVPNGASVGVNGVAPWMTRAEDFYLIDTAVTKPTIVPEEWELRIHGMVENELRISYSDLLAREFSEGWITLNCVSNEVGGDLIGNAWWSGVRVAELLAEAKPLPQADAILQTSADGWTCGTPLAAMTDDRNALLATSMNGEPLTIEHGFPVRVVVPGLYGYVSATKWVVDWEVSTFSDISAFWTDRGWGELGPVKMSSRIDVPARNQEVEAGRAVIAGAAWSQHTGISAVEFAIDGGAWQPADLADSPTIDAWVQWRGTADLAAGRHTIRVRATDLEGTVQTGAVADVLPDGSTGWHTIEVRAT